VPVIIEQTDKTWKLVKLISWITVIIGILIFLSHVQNGGFNNPMTGLGFCLAFFGLCGAIIGKFGAWWYHK